MARCLQVGTKSGFVQGVMMGSVMFIAFSAYALALWYGSILVIAGSLTGGGVVNVLYAAILGGVALGQAAPNIQYFISGKAAGARVFAVLDRQPLVADDPGTAPPVLCEVIGEPIKQSAKLSGEPIKRRVKRALRTALRSPLFNPIYCWLLVAWTDTCVS